MSLAWVPEEELSAAFFRDSPSSPSPPSFSLSSGGSRAVEEKEESEEEETPEGAVVATGGGGGKEAAGGEKSEAHHFAHCLVPEAGGEMKEVEERIEEMLIKLDEFCSITDMIRTDTTQLLDEMTPLIRAKMIEMNNIYTQVDKLEAFVKMVACHVSFLEEQVVEAEKTRAIFPCTVQKLLGIPSFKKERTSSPQHTYNLPELYRTEDYFNNKYIGSKYQNY
ncbi:breast carcinoma-amplified sequence 4 isoform X1 [Anolis carolinensis]|uniref:Breast carcinoma amplified sequence 4 n=1 Tax=Anolis carolinensis TaxID=28377 RepID=A0A803SXP9_ANOCA